jgi:hypothetical protein
MRFCLVGFSFVLAACGTSGRPDGTNGNGASNSSTGSGTGGTSTGTTGGIINPGQTAGSTSSTTGSATGGTTSGNNCGVQNFMLNRGTIPELLIVQDRSGSMAEEPDGSIDFSTFPNDPKSRWAQMIAAINQTVMNNSMIQWGLELFPDPNVNQATATGCEVPSTLNVPITANDSASIVSALNAASPGGSTPTTDAINKAVSYFTGGPIDSDGHPKYLLLATDGEPNCTNAPDDNANAEAAVANATKQGIHTFVVGIGTGNGNEAVLTAMANNGMEPNKTPGQPPYYAVSSTADLTAALTKITGQIISCSYALQQAPMNPDLVEIDSGSSVVPRDTTHMNGWDYGPGDMSIVFYGNACADLQNGVVQSVTAVYNCPPVS